MALAKPIKVATNGDLSQFASDDYVAGFGVGGAVPSGQSASYPPLYVNSGQVIGPAQSHVTNAYFDGTNWRFIGTGYATALNHGSGMLIFYQSTASGTAGNVVTFVERWRTDTSGQLGVGVTPSHRLHLAAGSTSAIGTASSTGGHAIIGGPGSPVSVRETFGTDGSGWQKRWAKNQGGTTTDLMTLTDAGLLHANPSYINVKAPQFGAVGDGSNDDTAAIAAAIAAAVSTGMRRVYLPRGTYKVTSTLTISGDMTLFGDGPSSSIILFDPAASDNCIEYTGVTTIRDNDKFDVIGLGIRANSSNANRAIYGAWTVSGTGAIAAQPCCLFSNVEIGSNSASAAFTYGIYLTGANHGTIENSTFYHYQSGAVKAASFGILLDGVGGTLNVTDFKVRGCTFSRVYVAAYFQDTEGVHFNENTVLSCDYGALWDTTLTSGKPYLDCSNNHFAVGITAISVNEMVQYFIERNLIYGLRSQSASATFYGISIGSGSLASGVNLNAVVADNTIIAVDDDGAFTTTRAITVAGGASTGESVLIKGNRSENCDRLIYLDTSCVNVTVLDDNTSTTSDTWEDVSGLNSLPYGTYTPTGYGITNCADADIGEYEANWTRTGNLITVYGDVDVDPTAAGAQTTFRLTLPFAVNVGTATMLSGVICPSGINAPSGTATMHTGTSPDRVEFNFHAPVATATRYSYTYRYRVG